MRKRQLQTKELDAIGRMLIADTALNESEIDQIALKPGLYEGVHARIRTEQIKHVFDKRSFGSYLNRYLLAFGSASTIVFFIGVLWFYMQPKPADFVSNSIKFPEPMPETARPEITPQVIVKGFTPGRASHQPAEQSKIERTVYIQPQPVRAVVHRAGAQSLPDAEFYPVTYAGDAGESVRGGRVIRVDVSRSTLFAMGVALPLENESATVKADLLVGPDGVTRAFRLVE